MQMQCIDDRKSGASASLATIKGYLPLPVVLSLRLAKCNNVEYAERTLLRFELGGVQRIVL